MFRDLWYIPRFLETKFEKMNSLRSITRYKNSKRLVDNKGKKEIRNDFNHHLLLRRPKVSKYKQYINNTIILQLMQ